MSNNKKKGVFTMKGFPKGINTAEDLFNCLAMVQAGQLQADDLKRCIASIENRKFISVPILSMNTDRKEIKTTYCAEAQEGQTALVAAVSCKIVAVQAEQAEADDALGDAEKISFTKIMLNKAAPAEALTIGIPSPIDPLADIGITEDQLNSIKVVLNQYE